VVDQGFVDQVLVAGPQTKGSPGDRRRWQLLLLLLLLRRRCCHVLLFVAAHCGLASPQHHELRLHSTHVSTTHCCCCCWWWWWYRAGAAEAHMA
jgi:hypothetical protein